MYAYSEVNLKADQDFTFYIRAASDDCFQARIYGIWIDVGGGDEILTEMGVRLISGNPGLGGGSSSCQFYSTQYCAA